MDSVIYFMRHGDMVEVNTGLVPGVECQGRGGGFF